MAPALADYSLATALDREMMAGLAWVTDLLRLSLLVPATVEVSVPADYLLVVAPEQMMRMAFFDSLTTYVPFSSLFSFY